MRRPVSFFAIAFCCLALACAVNAQTPRAQATARPQTTPRAPATPRPSATPPGAAAKSTAAPSPADSAAPVVRPQFRPAVLRTGPDSLVNRIDVKGLLAKGQKDGAVKFAASVLPDGNPGEVWTYHAMPGSELLEQEVLARLKEAKFTPPIYEHQPVKVILSGTVVFDADDAPHLRVFLNQDPEEIKVASDFIAPQPVIGANSDFEGLNAPATLPVPIEGVVDIELQIDAKGNLLKANLVREDPPLLGFAQAAGDDLAGAKFIPAFRDGDAAESSSVVSLCYKPIGAGAAAEEPSMLQGAPPAPMSLAPDTLSTPPQPK